MSIDLARYFVGSIRQYGYMVGMFSALRDLKENPETKNKSQEDLLGEAFDKLESEREQLMFFFCDLHDDRVESIRYEINDFRPEMSNVTIERVITYKDGKEKVEKGMIFPRDKAEKLVALMNQTS
jgi:hypothetical protein